MAEVFCRGVMGNGKGVIQALVDKGGVNSIQLSGEIQHSLYYIREDGIISSEADSTEFGKFITRHCTEIEPVIVVDKLPKEVDDVYRTHNSHIQQISNDYGTKLQLLDRLMLVRDEYNDGWKPDWAMNDNKATITCVADVLKRDTAVTRVTIFAFKDVEVRNKFWFAFHEELDSIKELI